MPETIYYQWQNDFLLRTIYPLRDTKLRDFLLFYYEIDIWKQYKGKQIQALPQDVQAYCGSLKKKVTEAYDTYQKLEAYLCDEDVTDEYKKNFPNPDPEIMAKINDAHKLFKRYYPTYKNPVKEKYFASERVRQFEELRKKIDFQIKDRKRVLRNMGPTWGKKAATEAEVQRLSTVSIFMVERELKILYEFLGAMERLAKNRVELNKRKTGLEKQRNDALARIKTLQTEHETLGPKLALVQRTVARLKNPPTFDQVKAHFLNTGITAQYQQRFPKAEAAVVKRVDDLHKAFAQFFPTYTTPVQQRSFLVQRLKEVDDLYKIKDQELTSKRRSLGWTAPTTPTYATIQAAVDVLQNHTLALLQEELGKLQDFQYAMDRRDQPAANAAAALAQAEKERADLDAKLKKNAEETTAQNALIQQVSVSLGGSEKDQMLSFLEPCQVTVQDIVRGKVEDYRAQLDAMTTSQMLEAVVKRFVEDPLRYPLWLQYMVIHFSGMRYQSAHGSWADPRDLLSSLRTKAVEQELKRASEDAVAALCEQKYLCYQAALGGGQSPTASGEGGVLPLLATAKEPAWRSRAEFHLKTLDPAKGYSKRKALLDLRISEEEYEIAKLADAEITGELETMKDQLPEWMWKEIVRVTELRLKEVKDANWEQAGTEEADERYAKGMSMFREILDKWKRENLTGWREEHDRANRLIVTRAVCNEVAEHIQHLRGQTPPGGLTAKPEWYMRNHKDPKQTKRPDKPYFVKTHSASDLRTGASIFWLRWVNKEPNMWQIARPLTLPNGEELVKPQSDARSSITSTGSAYIRNARWQEKDAQGKMVDRSETAWLRWMHEATIVEVTETADGPTVLTFETALPNEDRRQSTIGVFKHTAAELNYMVTASAMSGTLTGYVPEAAVPYADLKEMLDWNKILLRNAYTPEQIAAYWAKVEKPVAFALPEYEEMIPVEAAPPLLQTGHREWLVCYDRDTDGGLCIYQPEVALRRGMALSISREKAVQWNGEIYCKVTACDSEPRAEGLFLPESSVIDAQEGKSRRPVEARRGLTFYRLAGADQKGAPIFESSEMSAPAGTTFQISTVHRMRESDPGRGVVEDARGRDYVLVVESPRIDSAEGLFVRRSDVKRVTKQRYIDSFFEA